MRLKLDENLGRAALALLSGSGHEVSTVHAQALCGAPDSELIARCRDESRCLVTLDTEFGNPLLYPPHLFRGIIVVRVRPPTDRAAMGLALQTLVESLRGEGATRSGPDRGLWIVQAGRVRVYQPLRGPDNS